MDILKEQALIKIVEIIIMDYYGGNVRTNDELQLLLKIIRSK